MCDGMKVEHTREALQFESELTLCGAVGGDGPSAIDTPIDAVLTSRLLNARRRQYPNRRDA